MAPYLERLDDVKKGEVVAAAVGLHGGPIKHTSHGTYAFAAGDHHQTLPLLHGLVEALLVVGLEEALEAIAAHLARLELVAGTEIAEAEVVPSLLAPIHEDLDDRRAQKGGLLVGLVGRRAQVHPLRFPAVLGPDRPAQDVLPGLDKVVNPPLRLESFQARNLPKLPAFEVPHVVVDAENERPEAPVRARAPVLNHRRRGPVVAGL